MNYLLSENDKLVDSFSRNGEINGKRRTEMYVFGHEFRVSIHFVKERWELGKKFKLETYR